MFWTGGDQDLLCWERKWISTTEGKKKKKTSTQSPAHNLLSERTDCCCCFLPPDLFSKQKVLIFFFHSVLISTSANELSATEFKLPWSTILSDRKKWIYIEGGGKTKIKYVARLISKEKKKVYGIRKGKNLCWEREKKKTL